MDNVLHKERLADHRMWRSVQKTESCWIWTGSTTTQGYGYFCRGTRGSSVHIPSHRAAWFLTYGEIPDGMLVCHTCDVRRCVNPSHMFLGTYKDNAADMASKGRNCRIGKSKLKECVKGHDFAQHGIRLPNGHRKCLVCEKAHSMRDRSARRAAEAKEPEHG